MVGSTVPTNYCGFLITNFLNLLINWYHQYYLVVMQGHPSELFWLSGQRVCQEERNAYCKVRNFQSLSGCKKSNPSVISRLILFDIKAIYHSMLSLTTRLFIKQQNISRTASSCFIAAIGSYRSYFFLILSILSCYHFLNISSKLTGR